MSWTEVRAAFADAHPHHTQVGRAGARQAGRHPTAHAPRAPAQVAAAAAARVPRPRRVEGFLWLALTAGAAALLALLHRRDARALQPHAAAAAQVRGRQRRRLRLVPAAVQRQGAGRGRRRRRQACCGHAVVLPAGHPHGASQHAHRGWRSGGAGGQQDAGRRVAPGACGRAGQTWRKVLTADRACSRCQPRAPVCVPRRRRRAGARRRAGWRVAS